MSSNSYVFGIISTQFSMWFSEKLFSCKEERKFYSEHKTQREHKTITYYQIQAVVVSNQIILWNTETKSMLMYDRIPIQWSSKSYGLNHMVICLNSYLFFTVNFD